LGLAVSKRIVEKMGGNIWLTSQPGMGSKFSFTFTFEEGTLQQSTGESDLQDAVYTGKTILLVEDIEINREIIIAMLEPTGLEIDCAENGEKAVGLFTANPGRYHLIFMDIQMPVMDGITATQQIRNSGAPNAASVPIVALTANAFKEDIDTYLAVQMDDHLSKPMDVARLYELLKKYL
jgi:CheY-like chemotaxis protein